MRSDTKGYQVVEGEETTRPRPSNYLSPSRNSEDGLVNKARASVENNKLHWPPLRLAHTTPYHPYLPLDLYIIIYANLSSFECRINLRYVPVSFFFLFFSLFLFLLSFLFFSFFCRSHRYFDIYKLFAKRPGNGCCRCFCYCCYCCCYFCCLALMLMLLLVLLLLPVVVASSKRKLYLV